MFHVCIDIISNIYDYYYPIMKKRQLAVILGQYSINTFPCRNVKRNSPMIDYAI